MRPLFYLLGCLCLLGTSLHAAEPTKLVPLPKDVQQYNRLLGRGINLGNALEAPKEGEWGVTLEEGYFKAIEKAGFSSVRIPIRWSAHTGDKPPYEIDAAFLKRVDWAIDQALSRDLAVVLNVHHFDEVLRDPDKQEAKLLAIWKQIAEHYRDRNGLLSFELLNEPNDKLTDERWDKMIPALLDVVRTSNPSRFVIVGPGHWNNLNNLDKLNLPEKDRRLIVTFHYYSPFEFTHQGAEWVKDSAKWKGKTWSGTAKETEALDKDFEKAATWAKKNDRPLFLGEFGAYSAADMESRAKWTRAVVRAAEKQGFSWAYWEFCSGFGAYDKEKRAWHKPLLAALMDREP
jgi:endoglucanase